ncbi:hypothetical protein PDJAM_G00209040 [Pangasius djambal]|uniref:Uncharacterized protein n=1 Tax=Pangasius djambal TaxID=1691987 RepID=A0ACC5Y991_9TELE|nr:hypothetical protein [Pangasius djambal]
MSAAMGRLRSIPIFCFYRKKVKINVFHSTTILTVTRLGWWTTFMAWTCGQIDRANIRFDASLTSWSIFRKILHISPHTPAESRKLAEQREER